MAVSRYAKSASKNAGLASDTKAGAIKDRTVLRGEQLSKTSYANDPDVKAVEVRVGKGGTVYEYPIYDRSTQGGALKFNSWKQALDTAPANATGDMWHNNLAYATGRYTGNGTRNGTGNGGDTVRDTSGIGGGGPRITNDEEGIESPVENQGNPALANMKNWNKFEQLAYYMRHQLPVPSNLLNQETSATYRNLSRGAAGLAGITSAAASFSPKISGKATLASRFAGANLMGAATVDTLGDVIDPSRDADWSTYGTDMLWGASQAIGWEGGKGIIKKLLRRKAPSSPPPLPPSSPLPPRTPLPPRSVYGPQSRIPNHVPGTTVQHPAPFRSAPTVNPAARLPMRKQGGQVNLYRDGGVVSRYAARFPIKQFRGGGLTGWEDEGLHQQFQYQNGFPMAAPRKRTSAFDMSGASAPAAEPTDALGLTQSQIRADAQTAPMGAIYTASTTGGDAAQVDTFGRLEHRTPSSLLLPNKPNLSGLQKMGAAVQAPTLPSSDGQAQISRFAPSRDTMGYAMDLGRMALAAIPTKKADDMSFKPLNPSLRPVGVNEGAYDLARNSIASGVRTASQTRGSSMAEDTAMRLGMHANATEMNAGVDLQRAQALDADQQRFDQQQLSVEQYNNQGANAANQWNTQQAHARVGATEAAKAQAMQQSQQNVLTRRATENSMANQMTTQGAFGTIQARQAEAQKRLGEISTKMGDHSSDSPEFQALKREKDLLEKEFGNLSQQYLTASRQIGHQTVQDRSAARMQSWNKLQGLLGFGAGGVLSFKRGGSLSVGETMAVDNNRSQNRKEENALKHIQKLQSQILQIAAKAGIPRNKISRYTK